MCSAKGHVRFAPNSDRESEFPQKVMSALPPKADICSALARVRFVPIADSCSAAKRILFDHFVGASHKLRRRHGEAERLPFKKGALAPVAFQLAFERGAVIEAVKA